MARIGRPSFTQVTPSRWKEEKNEARKLPSQLPMLGHMRQLATASIHTVLSEAGLDSAPGVGTVLSACTHPPSALVSVFIKSPLSDPA